MKYLLELCLVALTFVGVITPSGLAQPSATSTNNDSLAGRREGRLNNLPGVKIQNQEAERNVSGEIVRYLEKPVDRSSPWPVAGEGISPLLEPRVEGKTLTFEVQHQRRPGCPELGPNVKFRMAFTGPNEAQLWNVDERLQPARGIVTVRQAEAAGSSTPRLQPGITVELPVTRNARPLPDADQPESLIVTVAADGDSYFGFDPMTPAGLIEKLKTARMRYPEKKLYLKADARTSYGQVLKALEAIDAAGVREPLLLTTQQETAKPGTRVDPMGLEVTVAGWVDVGAQPVVIQLFQSGQGSPTLKINQQNIPLSSLENNLSPLLNSRTAKVVLVRADSQVLYGSVVEVMDRCRSAGGKVLLVTGLAI